MGNYIFEIYKDETSDQICSKMFHPYIFQIYKLEYVCQNIFETNFEYISNIFDHTYNVQTYSRH